MATTKKTAKDKVIDISAAQDKSADKKFSTAKLDKLIKEHSACNEIPFKIGGQETGIVLKYSISQTDVIRFVGDVVDDVFDQNGDGTFLYYPSLYNGALAVRFIQYYTNIKTDIGFNRIDCILYGSTLLNDMQSMVNVGQWTEVQDAICKAIKFKQKEILSGERAKLIAISEQLDKATAAFTQLAELFGTNVDPDTIKRAFDNLSNMTEGELAKQAVAVLPTE